MLSRMVVHDLPGDGQPPKALRDELDHAAIMEDAFEPEVVRFQAISRQSSAIISVRTHFL